MSEPDEIVVSTDEANAEQEALAEVKEADVRAKVIADLGLSEEHNKELIDKLVGREMTSRRTLSTAIGQKIKFRDKLKTTPPKKEGESNLSADDVRKAAEQTVEERLEQRDLDEMDVSDEIKAEIKRVSKLTGVSVRKAAKDPYIVDKINRAKNADRVVEAAPERTPRSRPAPTSDKIPTFDMKTPEGRTKYQEWKKAGGRPKA